MSHKIEHVFHDIPVIENSKLLFENFSSSKEEHCIIAQQLLDFYLSQCNDNLFIIELDNILKENYLHAIHLLLLSFTYIVITKDDESFGQFIRRFIYESRHDSKEVFLLKKFFITNFDSAEEYYIGQINSHYHIKQRTTALLSQYIQFFSYYL